MLILTRILLFLWVSSMKYYIQLFIIFPSSQTRHYMPALLILIIGDESLVGLLALATVCKNNYHLKLFLTFLTFCKELDLPVNCGADGP